MLKYLSILILLLLPVLVISQDVSSMVDASDTLNEETWELSSEKPGIKVYTRIPENSNIKELRIKVDLKGDMDTLLNIVNDANNFGSWVYKCADSSPVTPPEGYNMAYAATTDFPFPMSDRELVAYSKQWLDEKGRIHTHTICAPDAIPVKSGIVRIQAYEARWLIEQVDEENIHVDYVSFVDPGGHIPAWIINLALTAGPMKTFEKLIDQVEKKSYIH